MRTFLKVGQRFCGSLALVVAIWLCGEGSAFAGGTVYSFDCLIGNNPFRVLITNGVEGGVFNLKNVGNCPISLGCYDINGVLLGQPLQHPLNQGDTLAAFLCPGGGATGTFFIGITTSGIVGQGRLKSAF